MLWPDVTAPESPAPHPSDPHEQRIRRAWRLLVGSFVILGSIAVLDLIAGGPAFLRPIVLLLVVVAGGAALIHRQAVGALELRRRGEVESFARILQGLSRSISPDAIVEAIVEELGEVTGADHVVVVRLQAKTGLLEATLVTTRGGAPASTTILPAADLDDPVEVDGRGPGGRGRGGWVDVGRAGELGRPGLARRVAERLAQRVRVVYGLRNILVEPLETPSGVIGAIVLSRRTDEPWPAAAGRLLAGAAGEASAALTRAYSHRAAEVRATTDALTGLPNRRYFDEVCSLIGRRRRADDAVGILMIDIDRFKALNDEHGHAVGDRVLRQVAGAIASAVRDDDVPARYGGEEFVVLLRNPARGVAVEVGERIRGAVRALDLSAEGVGPVSVSVGVALASGPDEPIAEIVAQADRALYRAKRAGRDRVVAA